MHGVVRVLSSPIPGVYATCSASARQFRRHWHDDFGVGVLRHGGQRWASRRGMVQAVRGAVINTVPGEVHDGSPLAGRPRHWDIVSFSPAVLDCMTGNDAGMIDIRHPVIHDARLVLALRRWLVLFERWVSGERSDVDVLAFESAMVECLAVYVSRYGTRRIPVDAVDVDIAAVRDRLADPASPGPSLGELASSVGISRFQLLRRFTHLYGMPPRAWLLNRRVERARQLIADGERLSVAALRAGFADQSHMTRTFTRMYGFTPGEWQRVHRRRS